MQWPHGLGTNRGFHTAINATHTSVVARSSGLAAAVKEARFAYACVNFGIWTSGSTLQAESGWTTDPSTRFSAKVFNGVVAMIQTGVCDNRSRETSNAGERAVGAEHSVDEDLPDRYVISAYDRFYQAAVYRLKVETGRKQ